MRRRSIIIAAVGVGIAAVSLALDGLILKSAQSQVIDKFAHVCAIISTPLDLLLLAASFAILASPSMGWILRLWSIMALTYSAGRFACAVLIVAPQVTAASRVAAVSMPPGAFDADFDGLMVCFVSGIIFFIDIAFPIFVLIFTRHLRKKTNECAAGEIRPQVG